MRQSDGRILLGGNTDGEVIMLVRPIRFH